MHPSTSPARLVWAGCLALAAAASAQAAPSYQLVDLGAHSLAYGVNATGKVAGAKQEGTVAAVYHHGTWGALPGGQTAYAVNDAGQAVGVGVDQVGLDIAYVWDANGTAQSIAPAEAGDNVVFSGAISSRGMAVGASASSRKQTSHCFHWQGGVTTEMPSPGDTCNANAVNGKGQIAGTMNRRRGGTLHAFIWQNGHFRDIGTFGGPLSFGAGINALGHVAVTAQYAPVDNQSPVEHAAIYKDGQLVDIGALPGDIDSQAFAINDSDEVVGLSYSLTGIRPFVYTGGQMLPLDTLVIHPAGFAVGTPTAIGNDGVIVGNGSLDGVTHAYLLRPVTN